MAVHGTSCSDFGSAPPLIKDSARLITHCCAVCTFALFWLVGNSSAVGANPDPAPTGPAPGIAKKQRNASNERSSSGNQSGTSGFCPGDLNGDSRVNVFDLRVLLQNFGATCPSESGDGSVTSSNLGPMARRIIDGRDEQASRCMLAIFGDSIQDWSNAPTGGGSYSIGIRDVWRCNWIGAAIHPDNGKDDIVGRHFSLGAAFPGGWWGYNDPVPVIAAWSGGSQYRLNDVRAPITPNGFSYKCVGAGTSGTVEPAWPTESGAVVFDGTVMWIAYSLIGNFYPVGAVSRAPSFTSTCVMRTSAASPSVTGNWQFARLGAAAQELRQFSTTGDWTTEAAVCDMIFYQCPTGFHGSPQPDQPDTFSLVSSRAGVIDRTVGGLTCYAPPGSEQWAAYSVGVNAGPGLLSVYARTGGASSTPTTIYFGGTHVYIPDAAGPRHGTELLPIGGNGSAKAMDMARVHAQRPDDLRSWCRSWRLDQGAVCMIMLGQNLDSTELNDIRGRWKANMTTIVSQLRTAITATPGAVSPMFILLSNPEVAAPYNPQVYVDMAQALYEISAENPDVGFCNLKALATPGATAALAGYFADGVHPSRPNSISSSGLSGVDYYASLIWGELNRAYMQEQMARSGSWARGQAVSR